MATNMPFIENLKRQLAKIRIRERLPLSNQPFNQINIIRILVITFLLTIIISLFVDAASPQIDFNPFHRTNPQQNGQGMEEGVPVDNTALPWNNQIPSGYSIANDGAYSDQYIEIYYESYKDTYHINVKEGYQYQFPQIQRFIESRVLSNLADFQTFRAISTTQIIYHDLRRPEGYPTPAIGEEHHY